VGQGVDKGREIRRDRGIDRRGIECWIEGGRDGAGREGGIQLINVRIYIQ
jgi:hypothetical protein